MEESVKVIVQEVVKSNVFAVLQDIVTGNVEIIGAQNKKELSKQISKITSCNLLGVFKGKKLEVKQKTAFEFV